MINHPGVLEKEGVSPERADALELCPEKGSTGIKGTNGRAEDLD